MLRVEFEDRIFWLAEHYVQSSLAWERMDGAKVLHRPWDWFVGRWRLEKTQQKRAKYLNRLLKRYKTTMDQVTKQIPLSKEQVKRAIALVHEELWNRVFQEPDDRLMAAMLWRALGKATPSGHCPDDLEPRFMLRQFVDEIAQHRYRDLLLELAYTPSDPDVPDLEELPEDDASELLIAYTRLHEVIVRHAQDLGVLMNGVLPYSWLRDVRSDKPETLWSYTDLLFGKEESVS
jgi:hypothetical protein